MELLKQVTSVELSNKLRKLFDAQNVQKFSIFHREWTGAKENEIEMWKDNEPGWCEDNIPCYTVSELGEILYKGIHKSWKSMLNEWTASYITVNKVDDENEYDLEHFQHSDTEANARAKMLIYLIEKKLISL